LDEWKALRGNHQKPQFNIRKAGEGEDPSQWKKMYALNKKANAEDDDEDDEYELAEYPQRVGRQKHLLDIDIHFSDARRGGRGRGGGRGGGRGRGGGPRPTGPSGGDRGPQDVQQERTGPPRGPPAPKQSMGRGGRQQSAPKVDDEKDFPSLG
jgi:plasminogen activator inhibitor 1 RNA-binding protein